VLRKRAIAAALMAIGASLICTVWTAAAPAAPTELTVRIEGREKTLFEGPILTEGHAVQASSDSQPRPCDGTNNGAHPGPVPTPTAASADALGLVGQTFDADWYPGFDDYFLTRWGPDLEDLGAGAFWGILVNGVFTPVGGCQFGDAAGDEVLWAYDAFGGRKVLRLAAAADPTVSPAAPLPTAHVEVGEPLALDVVAYEGSGDAGQPAAGIPIAPVATAAATGFQTVQTADPAAVTTAADGSAAVSFGTPGWVRLKAQKETGFIRSNRLDVCVEASGGGGCGALPSDAALRVPERYEKSLDPVKPAANPPPRPRPASNLISLGSVAVDAGSGMARLSVTVPGPGTLTLGGPKVVGQTRGTAAAGTVKLAVRPNARARRALHLKGRAQVAVTVTFTPTGGVPSSQRRGLTLRWAAGK
jgi:hypothetical protein